MTPLSTSGHKHTLADVKVLVKEDSAFKRKVKESIANHKKKPSLKTPRPRDPPPSPHKLMPGDPSGHVPEQSLNH